MATRKQRKGSAARRSSASPRSKKSRGQPALMAASRGPSRKADNVAGQSKMSPNGRAPDAISLLRADHREVEDLFAQFEAATGNARKQALVEKICDALTVHATIEEEIFYPEAREILKRAGEDMLDEAEVEHEGIKWRIELLQKMKPQDDLYDAEVKVLAEYVNHHVREEERKIFPRLRLSGFDNPTIGRQLAARKQQLTGKPAREEPTLLERGLRALAGSASIP